jgi:hypothetical protein
MTEQVENKPAESVTPQQIVAIKQNIFANFQNNFNVLVSSLANLPLDKRVIEMAFGLFDSAFLWIEKGILMMQLEVKPVFQQPEAVPPQDEVNEASAPVEEAPDAA